VGAEKGRREKAADELARSAERPAISTFSEIRDIPQRVKYDMIVVDHDLDEDPAGIEAIEALARRRPVIATARCALRTDIWLFRSCGVLGFAVTAEETCAALAMVLAGKAHWPPGLGRPPGWFSEPFPRRICSFIRSRERAKFARLVHDNALQTIEGLALAPGISASARNLLVAEGARLRMLVEDCRSDQPGHPPELHTLTQLERGSTAA
jgi:hypothetical protein